ncbi:Cys-tRNA(Pro)/Cys-tRNA(Cys) deacylase [Propionispira arboris]|uniref:Cys-tRNA(Pro)/Cys-tRNA(Cys) deacylase n=1 Tax=Propionispira arboris TaxID=84035 RepID=A0A1H6XKU5_9FIRM|nr:Cys-tRNA(Pro) deacylase [Propionispira arboris]SEJ25470.1 Cys-tRNA(Pro)/Cys-tRNA(Cys) deacylase [Propionispira arboris]
MKKTNAARILDTLKIKYEIKEYVVDINDLSAVHVASQVGMPVEKIFKTLVVRGDKNGVLMACIPGGGELDLKTLAVVSGNKKVEMVHLKEVQGLTGYIRGGCSPIGAKKEYPVFLDESAKKWDIIAISAGVRGAQFLLTPADLIRAVQAKVHRISR